MKLTIVIGVSFLALALTACAAVRTPTPASTGSQQHPTRSASPKAKAGSAIQLPSGVAEIAITSRRGRNLIVGRRFKTVAKVRRVEELFAALQKVTPFSNPHCSVLARIGPVVSVAFLGSDGAQLARAVGTDHDGTSTPCNPIFFTVHGQRGAALLRGRFLLSVQRLLGVDLLGAKHVGTAPQTPPNGGGGYGIPRIRRCRPRTAATRAESWVLSRSR